jgi:hypothetical protein
VFPERHVTTLIRTRRQRPLDKGVFRSCSVRLDHGLQRLLVDELRKQFGAQR